MRVTPLKYLQARELDHVHGPRSEGVPVQAGHLGLEDYVCDSGSPWQQDRGLKNRSDVPDGPPDLPSAEIYSTYGGRNQAADQP